MGTCAPAERPRPTPTERFAAAGAGCMPARWPVLSDVPQQSDPPAAGSSRCGRRCFGGDRGLGDGGRHGAGLLLGGAFFRGLPPVLRPEPPGVPQRRAPRAAFRAGLRPRFPRPRQRFFCRQIHRKNLGKIMKKRENPLDIPGDILYYNQARVQKEWAQYAMKREIASKTVTSAEYVRSSGG